MIAESPQSDKSCVTCKRSACPTRRAERPFLHCTRWLEIDPDAKKPAGAVSVPSVSSVAETVLSKEQAGLVDEIKGYHAGFRLAFEHQVQYAFMAGVKLTALKDTCDHGNAKGALGFMAIREQFLPEISRSAATRYLDFFGLCREKIPTVGNISGSCLKLTNGELPETEKKQLLDAVHDAAEGKTWTAFYRDLDLCRQKKAHTYHAPDPKKAITEEKESPLADMLEEILDLADPDQEALDQEDTEFLRKLHAAATALLLRIAAIGKKRKVKNWT
jgi:hypothetical protein